MYHYQCYGLKIASEVELTSLIPFDADSFDVSVAQKESLSFEKTKAKYVNGFWINQLNQVFFEVVFGSMLISEGETIEFVLNKGAQIEDAVQHVLGSGIAAILIQRKKLVLHASVVEKDGEATLFIGRSGAGKSSTAWTFIKNGYTLLSDDLAVIEFENGVPFVQPGYPRNKIAEDVILETERFIDIEDKPIKEDRLKYYRYPDQFLNSKIPVQNIFLLSHHNTEDPIVEEIENVNKFQLMYRNSFRFSIIKPLGFSKQHLKLCTSMFEKVKIVSIKIPSKKLCLSRTFDLIESEMSSVI